MMKRSKEFDMDAMLMHFNMSETDFQRETDLVQAALMAQYESHIAKEDNTIGRRLANVPNGKDCKCNASCKGNCVCGAEWRTPIEHAVYVLRDAERDDIEKLIGPISNASYRVIRKLLTFLTK